MPRADPQTIRRASVSGRTESAVASRESPTRLLIVLCFWLMLSIHDLVAGLIESCRDPMLLEKLRTPTSAERRILLGLPAENPEHMRKLRIPSFEELEAAEEAARPKSVPQPSPCSSKPMRTKVLEVVKRTVSLPQPLRRLSSPLSIVSPKLEVISRFRTSPSLASLDSPALSASPTVLPPSLSFAQSPRPQDMDPEATLRIETDLSQPLSSSPPSSSSTASTGSGRGSPGLSPLRAAFSPWLLRRRYSSSASIEAIPEEDIPVDSGACVESPVSSSDGSEFPALSSHMTGPASSPDLDTDLDSPNLTTVPPRRIATAALQIKKASLAMIAMKPSNSVPAGDVAGMAAPTPSPRSFSAPGMSRMRRRISIHRPSPAVSRVN